METNVKKSTAQKVLTVIALALCIIFGFMLICNIVIIVKGTVSPERPPSVIGVTPLVVLSGSMSGDAPDHIEAGDLIFVTPVVASDLKVGDVITFMQGKTVVTHRIVNISTDDNGKLQFLTKGDANNTEDTKPVSEDDLVGIYRGRVPKVGDLAIFMQTPLGMILFIGVPMLVFLGYDIIRRQKYAAKDQKRTAELEAELERLRALAAEKETPEE
ncbi:MAG: signal peptidase I [Oscillospiraceae bacterium]|nr:signal peptidase I [Oscillospiraceae bacterium]